MNSTTKAVMASAVVIALCLCVVGGTTYSWFSDTERADIDITAGNIELEMTFQGFYIQSYGDNAPVYMTDEGDEYTTTLGGKVSYTTSTGDGTASIEITFTNAAPGDMVGFEYYGTLTNSINVYYSETSQVTETTDTGLESPFIVNGLSQASVSYAASQAPHNIKGSDDCGEVVVMMDTQAGNNYKSTSYTVSIVFQAVQANAPSQSTSTSVSVGAGNNIVNVTGQGMMSSATVSFTSATATDEILTVSSLSQQSADGYSISTGNAILGGVEVTSSNGGDALQRTPVTVSMVLAGDLSNTVNTPLTFYHGSVPFNPAGGYTATYDSASDTTIVVFQTSDGFSPYFVTSAVEAKIGGTYYPTIENAIDASSGDERIQILVDVTLDSDLSIPIEFEVPEGFDVTVNLNGYNIISQQDVFRVLGSLTLEGDGMVMAGSHDGTIPVGEEYVTLFAYGGTITIDGGTYIAQDKAEVVYVHDHGQVYINDGMFGSLSTETDWGNVLNVSNGTATVDCIVVRGGVFANYNPASGDDNLGGSFLADGYVTLYDDMSVDLQDQSHQFTGYTVYGSDNLDLSNIATAGEFYAALQLVPENGTIVLQDNITIEDVGQYGNGTPSTYCLVDGITMDLNGHTITVLTNDRFMFAGDDITVKNGTVQAGSSSSSSSGYISYPIAITSGAQDATFEDLVVYGGIEALGNGASLTLNNVTAEGTNYYAVYLAGGATVTINGGSYEPGDYEVCFYTQTAADTVIVNSASTIGTLHGGMGSVVDNRTSQP